MVSGHWIPVMFRDNYDFTTNPKEKSRIELVGIQFISNLQNFLTIQIYISKERSIWKLSQAQRQQNNMKFWYWDTKHTIVRDVISSIK